MPSAMRLRAERPEAPLLSLPVSVSVPDGFDADDVVAGDDERTPFAFVVAVAVIGEEAPPPAVEVAPVALATGTNTDPAVTVDVAVASALPPHTNMTAGMTKLPYKKQLFSWSDGSESGCAHA